MISVSIGTGKREDARRAGMDAMTQALATLPNKHADCVLVFGSTLFDQDELLGGVADAAPHVPMTGCSTAGEISSEGLSTEGSVVAVALASDVIRFGTGFGTHMEWNPRQSGIDCAHAIHDSMEANPSSAVLFANVLSGGMEKSLMGLREQTGGTLDVVAGGAADNFLFHETSQYHNGSAYSDAIAGLGLSGTFAHASVALHGFLPVGMLRQITKADGNIIQEIDGAPAIRLYEEYFGDQYAAMLQQGKLNAFAASYPLGIYEEGSVRPFLRSPIRIDIEKGIIICAGNIPVQAGLRLMISDTQQALTTARDAARALMAKLGNKKPRLVLMFSSAARRRVLARGASGEVRAVQEEIGIDVPLAGFYSYAEQASEVLSSDVQMLHNGSLVLWALAE